MANIKSAKKRIKVTAKKTLRNKAIRTRTKTAVKKLLILVTAGDKAGAEKELPNTVRALDKAASKGVYHKNNTSRRKGRLAKKVHNM